jgi:endonuclease YncB( thermonuclease family)
MHFYRPLHAALVCLLLCVSVCAQKTVFNARVIEVVDGSTILVETQNSTNFVVDCLATTTPQLQEPFGEYSRERLASLVMGQTVAIEYAKPAENGRIAGTIFFKGTDVCLDQIREGAASFNREAQIDLSSSTRDVYAGSENRARQNGVGLWKQAQGQTELTKPLIPSAGTTVSNGSTVDVRGYYRKDGTYVEPHKRTAPDAKFDNNWSTVRNVNPHTGKPGTKSWFARHWWIFPTVGALVGTSFLIRRTDGVGSGIPCNDGTFSQAQNRQGACSHHGGSRR